MFSLVNFPYVVLDRIIGYLDRDEVATCRQVNRFLRRFIDANRHHYPLPPITISIESEKFFRTSVAITKTMVWTGARRNIVLSERQGMSMLEQMWQAMLEAAELEEREEREEIEEEDVEGNEENNSEKVEDKEDGKDDDDVIEEFLSDDDFRTRIHSVPSIINTTAKLFTRIFEKYYISVLEIDEVGSDILKGIASSSKKSQQTVERLDLNLQTNQVFLRPHNLKIGNIDAKDISKVLTLPTVSDCFRLDFDMDTDEVATDAPVEVFLSLRCERLNLPIGTTLNSATLNLILKEWHCGKRNFASVEAWELFGAIDFDPLVVFDGLMCQKFTARSPRASLPPATYYRISRSHESLTVFTKGTALLINHPVDYMLSIGSVFR
ncbi:unnamed protein product, partial [Mesorhabditis belari]|uniref:F-box domain-containing protein n=1 Tax=Mesorhabditis belari TaxID=2138241 RepID=A0AAF3EAT2_9BILA